MNATKVTPDALSAIMEFDRVIRVHPDGSITADAQGWAPVLTWQDHAHHLECHPIHGPGWELLHGYSGQHGYSGPIMHPSEYIGGGLARAILATPGLYVALVCEVLPEECQHGPGDGHEPECDPEQEPAGWAVATVPDEA